VSSERALTGLLRQIESAQAAGARIALGGRRVDRPGFYLEPTIITDIDPKNPLFSQETFGPVASVYVVDTEDEAVALANATPFGLGSSVFSGDLDRARRVADRIDSGMVFINQPTNSLPELPFGGIKNSGYGRELSELGFGEFTNRKLINAFPPGTRAASPTPPYDHARGTPLNTQVQSARQSELLPNVPVTGGTPLTLTPSHRDLASLRADLLRH
jgi:succinate-semialdehyde dehydrogenase/glutarate-semialdehyde dehydrogenase